MQARRTYWKGQCKWRPPARRLAARWARRWGRALARLAGTATFTITFTGSLANQDVGPITWTTVTTTAVPATLLEGSTLALFNGLNGGLNNSLTKVGRGTVQLAGSAATFNSIQFQGTVHA